MKYRLRTFILAWLLLSLTVALPCREVFLARRDALFVDKFDKIGEECCSRIDFAASEDNIFEKLFGRSRVVWLMIGRSRDLSREIEGSVSCEQLQLLAQLSSLKSLVLDDVIIEACTEIKCRNKLRLEKVSIYSTDVTQVKETLKSLSLILSEPVELSIPKWRLTTSEIEELEKLPIVEKVTELEG